MNSTRLPGKVMRHLCGKPMIEHIVMRLRDCRKADRLVVATGQGEENDVLSRYVEGLNIEVFRGSEGDVLDRFTQCAKRYDLDIVVRATGDNPFVDPEECDKLLAFRAERDLDYASAFPDFGSRFPVGIGVEVMTAAALDRSFREGLKQHHREHVNEYIQENPAVFKQDTLIAPPEKQAPDLSLTVDTPEDFARAEALMSLWMSKETGRRNGGPTTPWLIDAAQALI